MEDAQHALATIEGALVLGFHLDGASASFELVYDYWDKRPEASRALAQLRFESVQHFERVPGARADFRHVDDHYVSRDVPGAFEIEVLRTRVRPGHTELQASLGSAFGGFEFRYQQVALEVVHLTSREAGDSVWSHRELDTGRPIDFHNPFSRPWAEPAFYPVAP